MSLMSLLVVLFCFEIPHHHIRFRYGIGYAFWEATLDKASPEISDRQAIAKESSVRARIAIGVLFMSGGIILRDRKEGMA
jgi:hypothetical protein